MKSKKGFRSLESRLDQRFSLIHEFQESWDVVRLCRVFEVNLSSYRYWAFQASSIHPARVKLIAELKRWFGLSNGSAGERTLVTFLAQPDYKVSRWLVNKLMKQEGIVSRQLPTHRYAKAEKEHVCILNLLNRDFDPKQPNQILTGYVTYVWSGTRWLYLAVVIDLYARRVVGWTISKSPDS